MMTFWEAREKWETDARVSLVSRGYRAEEISEVCDDGRIHFAGQFYLSRPLVTAWKDSPYFQE